MCEKKRCLFDLHGEGDGSVTDHPLAAAFRELISAITVPQDGGLGASQLLGVLHGGDHGGYAAEHLLGVVPCPQEASHVHGGHFFQSCLVGFADQFIIWVVEHVGTGDNEQVFFSGEFLKRGGEGVEDGRFMTADECDDQSGVGEDGLEKGDLVFFATRGSGKVSHVGIYIGDGQFIHAPSRGKTIRIESLSTEYFARNYVGAKKYF